MLCFDHIHQDLRVKFFQVLGEVDLLSSLLTSDDVLEFEMFAVRGLSSDDHLLGLIRLTNLVFHCDVDVFAQREDCVDFHADLITLSIRCRHELKVLDDNLRLFLTQCLNKVVCV